MNKEDQKKTHRSLLALMVTLFVIEVLLIVFRGRLSNSILNDIEMSYLVPTVFSIIFLGLGVALVVAAVKLYLTSRGANSKNGYKTDAVLALLLAVLTLAIWGPHFISGIQGYASGAYDREIGLSYLMGSKGKIADSESAESHFRKGIEKGDALASYGLARLYEGAIGHEVDPEAAFSEMEKAMSGGSQIAYYYLGRYYLEGFGVAKDLDRALNCFERCEESGLLDKYHYGMGLYYRELSRQPDLSDTERSGYEDQMYQEMLTAGGDHSSALAALFWGRVFLEGNNRYEKNEKQALDFFSWGCDNETRRGETDCYYEAGLMYYYGKGTSVNYDEATKLFHEAGTRGNGDACAYLALMLRPDADWEMRQTPEGGQDSAQAALEWLERGKDYGSKIAEFELGNYYIDGVGRPDSEATETNKSKGESYRASAAQEAAAAGYQPAIEYVEEKSTASETNDASL